MRRLAVWLLIWMVSCTVAFAQPAETTAPLENETPEQDAQDAQEVQKELALYAMLDPNAQPPQGPLAKAFEQFAPNAKKPRLGVRPIVLWHHWANQRKPFFPSLIIMLFASITISALMPTWTQNAQVICKKSFWRTFLIGVLGVVVGITAVRGALVSMIGWPLAVICMGLLQLGILSGLTVMILLLGQSLGSYLKVDKWIARPDVRRLFCILIGAVVCAALLQIGGAGMLPRIGTRLVALLGVVGLAGYLERAESIL